MYDPREELVIKNPMLQIAAVHGKSVVPRGASFLA
jgi:hypothetical protein